jgi:hypothetical protein
MAKSMARDRETVDQEEDQSYGQETNDIAHVQALFLGYDET